MAQQRQTDDMAALALDAITAELATVGCTLRLFKNNITPAWSDNVSMYVEADFASYAPIPFTDWGGAVVSAHIASSVCGSKVFTMGTPGTTNNIYGAYVTRDSDGALLLAQRDDAAPFAMDTLGKTYTVVPLITYHSEYT